MCGIVGAVGESRTPLPDTLVQGMRDVLAHRGPDDAGTFRAGRAALGSRRLSIIDLSARGHMPMATPDGRYQITYNGEIYNFRDVRRDLEALGVAFRSHTDTEVLLHGYANWGPAVLDRLNGMFAFAVWDEREGELFLARDRLGVKPLYYVEKGGDLWFASEQKALFAAGLPAEFDESTWPELLAFRFVAGEQTPFRGVKRLLPGHWLKWRGGRTTLGRYWDLGERIRVRRHELPDDPIAWFRATFDEAVALRRVSDVPVGVLLSGGLDSSSVAASLAAQGGPAIASFTVRFSDKGFDEGPLAAEVARKLGLEHYEIFVPEHELVDRLRRAAWFNDEPLVHYSDAQMLAVSEFAKAHVSVLLSGEGADETLGGYVRYQPLRWPVGLDLARSLLRGRALNLTRRLHKLASFLSLGSTDAFVLWNAAALVPGDLEAFGGAPDPGFLYREHVLREAKQLYPGSPARQAMYSDQKIFLCSILDRNDRMTMGASIECRVPFLDYRLVEVAGALPDSVMFRGARGKRLLLDAVGHRLPRPVLRSRKWGFGVPWTRYMRDVPGVRDLIRALPDAEPIKGGPLDRGAVRGAVTRFLAGDPEPEALLKNLMMIALWHEICVRGAPSARSLASSAASA